MLLMVLPRSSYRFWEIERSVGFMDTVRSGNVKECEHAVYLPWISRPT